MREANAPWDPTPSPSAGLLQLARARADLTQREIAQRAGVPRSMVSAYERGLREPTMSTLLRLLRAAGFELRLHLTPYVAEDDADREAQQRTPTAQDALERRWHRWHSAADAG